MRGPAAAVADRFAAPPKGEITLVVGASVAGVDEVGEAALAAVAELLDAGVPRKQAVAVVARLARTSRNTLYAKSLQSG